MTRWSTRSLSGWGRYPVIEAQCARPQDRGELLEMFEREASSQGDEPQGRFLAHGMGRSYGDAALLTRGGVVLTAGLGKMLNFDETRGVLTCEAGVTLEEILDTFVPRGYFVPVAPGTRYVSVGGAIGCNIHGKNHHVDGCFGDHVERMEVLLASGEVVMCSREEREDLFWATIGGMGLTGVILSAAVRLMPVQSEAIDLETIRVENLEEFFAISDESLDYTHVVSWIDTVASGKRLGRGVFMRGRHAGEGVKVEASGVDRLAQAIGKLANGKSFHSDRLLNRFTVRAFNEAYFRKERRGRTQSVVHYKPFFFPLDAVPDWNYIYGPRGFLQYQFVVPEREAVREALTMVASSKEAAFLAVLKEFGDRDHGGLSFPQRGFTLAMDFPNTGAPLLKLCERLDALVLEAKGRVYLGKDARLPGEHLEAMYPDLERWREVKRRYDPERRFTSDLARRLGLVSARP